MNYFYICENKCLKLCFAQLLLSVIFIVDTAGKSKNCSGKIVFMKGFDYESQCSGILFC